MGGVALEPETIDRHDVVLSRMQTLIDELDRSLDRVRALLTAALERNDALRQERNELRERCNKLMHRLQELEVREQ